MWKGIEDMTTSLQALNPRLRQIRGSKCLFIFKMIFQENIICQKKKSWYTSHVTKARYGGCWMLSCCIDRPVTPKAVTSRPKLVKFGISQNCMDFRYAHHIYSLWEPNVEKTVELAMQFDKTQGTDMHLNRYRKVREMFKSYRFIILTLSILR